MVTDGREKVRYHPIMVLFLWTESVLRKGAYATKYETNSENSKLIDDLFAGKHIMTDIFWIACNDGQIAQYGGRSSLNDIGRDCGSSL